MILAVDVQYTNNEAYVAGLMFESWQSEEKSQYYLTKVVGVEEYQPGFFYKRELPCILKLLKEYHLQPSIIIIDGYVYLDGVSSPGLGKYLYDSLNAEIEVIGVAKKPFKDISDKFAVYRGKSSKPLYVTTTGNLLEVKDAVTNMAGKNRFPMLLKEVDRLCRSAAKGEIKPN